MEELHNIYLTTNNIRVIKSRRICAGNVAYSISVGKPEGKRPLGRPRPRCEDILKWILGK
jgi:hypothetical protein